MPRHGQIQGGHHLPGWGSCGSRAFAVTDHRPVNIWPKRLNPHLPSRLALDVDGQMLAGRLGTVCDVCQMLPGSLAARREFITFSHRHRHEEGLEISHDLKITTQLSDVKHDNNRAGNSQPESRMVQCAMHVKTARMLNLRNIIESDFKGNAGACADVLGMKRPQIHRWITPNPEARQGISEESARAIEQKLGKPPGALDALPDGLITSDNDSKVISEFAWIYHNATEEGRAFLCNAIKAASKTFLKKQ